MDMFLILTFVITKGEGVVVGPFSLFFTHSLSYYFFWFVLFTLSILMLNGNECLFPPSSNHQLNHHKFVSLIQSLERPIIFTLFGTAIAIYILMAFFGEKLSDDYMILDWVGKIRWSDWTAWTSLCHNTGFIRPLPLAWWKLDGQMWGSGDLPLYIESLIIHLTNTVLIYLLAKRFPLSNRSSKAIALLFFVLPTGAYSVGWLSSRYDLLVTCFGLIF